jgi:hypothetical protein
MLINPLPTNRIRTPKSAIETASYAACSRYLHAVCGVVTLKTAEDVGNCKSVFTSLYSPAEKSTE